MQVHYLLTFQTLLHSLQNKVIAGELKSIKSKIGTDESAIKQNTSNITSNTKRIEANETAISTLNGTGNGSVKKAVSDGIAKVVAGAPEDFDTLKEMSDWISTHETSASAMNSAIKDNKSAITALQIGKADKTEIPIVPTNVSEFTNDAGYLTEHQDISNLVIKEEGKGLSSNDYTSEEKTKLGGVGTSQGRNLIPYPLTDRTTNGITYTVQSDGSVLANGTASAENNAYYNFAYKTLKLNDTSYTLSCEGLPKSVYVYVYDETIGKAVANVSDTPVTKIFVGDSTHTYSLSINVGKGTPVSDLAIKPILEMGTIAHAYEPISESNVNLKKEIDKTSTLQGQNLIPYPYDGTEGNTNGITWTVNDDGSVTANGTASKEAPYSLIYPYNLSTMKSLQLGNTYIISDGLTDEQHTNVGYMQLVRYDKNNPTNWKCGVSSMKGTEIYTANDENTLQYGIRLIIRNGATANNITFKPMLEVGTMSHEYQPTTISNTSLNERLSDQQGQNLIPYPYYRPDSYTNNGITWTVNEDGSVTANGTATATAHYTVFIGKLGLEIGKNYVLTITTVKGQASLYLANKNKQNINTDIAACRTVNNSTLSVIFKYSQTDDFDRDELGLYIVAGTTLTNCIIKFQLERGTIRHEYQPTTLSNPTLKKEIGSALQPESIVNNQTTTVAGFSLDARQANPNIDGSLAKQISDLNGSLSNVATKNDISTLNPSGAIRLYSDKTIGIEGAGWYRFAKIVCDVDTIAKGSTYICIETLIRQSFSNALGCFHKIDFYLIYSDSARISVTGYNTNVLKRVRIVRSGNTIFLDVYSGAFINSTEILSFIPFNEGIQSAEHVEAYLVPEISDGEVIVRSVDLADNI